MRLAQPLAPAARLTAAAAPSRPASPPGRASGRWRKPPSRRRPGASISTSSSLTTACRSIGRSPGAIRARRPFSHKPRPDRQIGDHGYDLAALGAAFVAPMDVYSSTANSIDALPDGARIAIPNDPSNGGRALLLLKSRGLIDVDAAAGPTPSPLDVVGNPKGFAFVELDAAQPPRPPPDVDAAAINTDHALEAGLSPLKDALPIESAESPYANVFVARSADRNAQWAKTIVETYRSESVRRFIIGAFKGGLVPAFRSPVAGRRVMVISR